VQAGRAVHRRLTRHLRKPCLKSKEQGTAGGVDGCRNAHNLVWQQTN
jgi:hypothetical protein